MQAELTFTKQLKKAFKIINQRVATWDETIEECGPSCESIKNLAEQLECCQKVNIESTPLKDFPDLTQKLFGKIINALEEELTKLLKYQEELQDISDRVSKEYNRCMSVYERNSKQLSIEMMVERTPLRPSFTDMLELIQEIDNMFHHQLSTRDYYIQQVDYAQPSQTQEAMGLLNKQGKLQTKVEDMLIWIKYFMEDDT